MGTCESCKPAVGKALAVVVAAVVVAASLFGCKDDKGGGAGGGAKGDHAPPAAARDIRAYEVLATVDYQGPAGQRFMSQSSGLLAVEKTTLPSGQVAYGYTFQADVMSDIAPDEPNNQFAAEVTFPAVRLDRDPRTERFVGGDRLLRNPGLLSNAALEQVKTALPLDGSLHRRTFRLVGSPNCAKRIDFGGRRRQTGGVGGPSRQANTE